MSYSLVSPLLDSAANDLRFIRVVLLAVVLAELGLVLALDHAPINDADSNAEALHDLGLHAHQTHLLLGDLLAGEEEELDAERLARQHPVLDPDALFVSPTQLL